MNQITRRQFVSLAAAVGGSVLVGGLAGCTAKKDTPSPAPAAPKDPDPLELLAITGPQSPATVLLARLAMDERVKKTAKAVTFATVKNPDQLRAAIAAKEAQVAAVPTNVAATLYRRGVPLQLINVTVWGTLYVMTADDNIKTWADLKGRNVVVPLKGDIPDLVFRYLAGKNGLDLEKDVKPSYIGTTPEAMQLLLAGKADAVVLAEPVNTAAEIQGQAKGIKVRAALDLQAEWGKATGRPARFPQVGTVALTAVTKDHPEVAAAINDGLKAAVDWARANPAEAGTLGEQTLADLKSPVIQKSLSRTPMEVVPAAAAREELEFFFARLKELSPEIIGGDLPDAAFYYGVK